MRLPGIAGCERTCYSPARSGRGLWQWLPLGSCFRHLLPGVLIVAAARLAHPFWFQQLDLKSTHHLIALGILAVVVGNAWFALNRYGVYQVLDYLLYRWRIQGPARGAESRYVDDLGRFAATSLRLGENTARARQHVAFRASTVLLVFTLAELAIICGLWPDSDSVLAGYRCWLILGGIAAIPIAVWQEVITRRIDHYVVNPP